MAASQGSSGRVPGPAVAAKVPNRPAPSHRSRSSHTRVSPTNNTPQQQIPQLTSLNIPPPPQVFQYPQRWGQQQNYQHQQMGAAAPPPTSSTPPMMYAGPPAPPPPSQQLPCNSTNGAGNMQQGLPGNPFYPNNPFLPPSIKVSLLRKIHRRDFVEFEELLPDNQVVNAGTRHESCISIDRASQTLKFDKDKIKKQKVDTLAKWLIAWTAFMQAYLHYHPNEYFELFTYLKNFIMLANRYRFDACLNYDRYFRLSMANQQTLSADLRSVSWLTISEEYRAMYLLDSPIPNCFNCKSRGHLSTNCPEKKGESSTANTASTSFSAGSSSRAPTFRRNRPQQPQPLMSCNAQPQQQQSLRTQPNSQQNRPLPAQYKPCFRFNGGFPCTKPPCQFVHACSLCFRDPPHPATQCDQGTHQSAFRPDGNQRSGH